MKKTSVVAIFLISILSFSAHVEAKEKNNNSKQTEVKVDYTKSNSKFKKTNTKQKAEFTVLAKKEIKKLYKIDSFKIDDSNSSLSVHVAPDEKSADGKEEFKNILNGAGEFSYKKKIYNFTFIYSKSDANHYRVLYLYSNYDKNNQINVGLESD